MKTVNKRQYLFRFAGVLAFRFFVVASIFISCKSEESDPQIDCSASDLAVQVVSQTDTECAAANGAVELAASGGSGNYNYKVGTRSFQASTTFSDLSAGIYTVTVKDDNNCEATTEVSINNTDGVNMAVAFSAAGCKEDNGSITITPSDGAPPYQYKIGDMNFQDDNSFENLSQGNYTVTTKDATECEVTQQVNILSGISYAASVATIISTNCAVSGCHNGSQTPDFRNFSTIKANASSIKSEVVSRRMPKEGSLTQAEIDAISCWVDDGAPNN